MIGGDIVCNVHKAAQFARGSALELAESSARKEAGPIFPHQPPLDVSGSVRGRFVQLGNRRTGPNVIGTEKRGKVTADDVGWGISEEFLTARVPTVDRSRKIDREDRVVAHALDE